MNYRCNDCQGMMELDKGATGAFGCPHCGSLVQVAASSSYSPVPYHQQQQPVYANPPKQVVVYVLLGIFLGTLGIHNFYAGFVGKGIAQLLISVLAGWMILPYLAVFIWIIVEICTVRHDAQGIPMQ